MKTLFALFGLIVLLLLAVLTGGLGLLVILIGSETMREAFRKLIAEIINQVVFEDGDDK
jgi:hypothetical protein